MLFQDCTSPAACCNAGLLCDLGASLVCSRSKCRISHLISHDAVEAVSQGFDHRLYRATAKFAGLNVDCRNQAVPIAVPLSAHVDAEAADTFARKAHTH